MERVQVELRGLQPLLMKSARGVDPTDPVTKQMKAITSKRKKTDADLAELDRLEFMAGLYWNEQYVFIPDVNIIGAIRDGAKANRRGREVSAGVDVSEAEVPLLYDGPKNPEALYKARFSDRRMIKNKGGGGSVMRVRPRFTSWRLAFTLVIDTHVIATADVREALAHAGLRVGLGDFRPRFGRFEVSAWKEAA